jgi:hypothetical protein
MAVLVSDSFNRANSTTTLGTTDSYAGGTAKTWALFGLGAYGINNNQAYASTAPGSGRNVAYVDAGVSDGSVSCVISNITQSSEFPKLCFRIQNEANMLYVEYEWNSGQIDLRKYVGGTSTLIGQYSGTFIVGATLKIVTNGSSITVYLNGTQIITATDTFNQTQTRWGICSYNYPNPRFDNFVVSDLDTGTNGSTLYDLKQVLYSDSNVKADTKQSLYGDSLFNADMRNGMYSDSATGYDAKQSLYQDASHTADTTQTIYRDAYEIYDTLQELFSDGIIGSAQFDLRFVLYAEAISKADTAQRLYTDGTIDFDKLQQILEDWTEYNEVIRIILDISQRQTLNLAIMQRDQFNLDITQRNKIELDI